MDTRIPRGHGDECLRSLAIDHNPWNGCDLPHPTCPNSNEYFNKKIATTEHVLWEMYPL